MEKMIKVTTTFKEARQTIVYEVKCFIITQNQHSILCQLKKAEKNDDKVYNNHYIPICY